MAGPLSGVRVIELPAIGPAPLLAMLLSDLGADVIRVDRLGAAAPGLAEAMATGPLGRGRRSIGIDLRHPAGAEVVLRLAGTRTYSSRASVPAWPSGSASDPRPCTRSTRAWSTAA